MSTTSTASNSLDWGPLFRQGTQAQSQGDLRTAISCYRRAQLLSGDNPEPTLQLGLALYHYGLEARAAECFTEVLQRFPSSALAQLGFLVCALRTVPHDLTEADQSVSLFRTLLEQLRRDWLGEVAPASHDVSLAAEQREAIGVVQPFALAYYGENVVEEQHAYGQLIAGSNATDRLPHPTFTPGKRIRLGIVSAFFCDHSNWWVPIKGWLKHFDRSRFEIWCYHVGRVEDKETALARSWSDHFLSNNDLSQRQESKNGHPFHASSDWAAQIRSDR
ncbi:MAG: hypothetical protein AAF742_09630, partial [Pseudomonadota bacterium]